MIALDPKIKSTDYWKPSIYWPWKVCFFLLFATMISYLDRQAFSIIGPVVKEELVLSNEKLGLLFSAFYLSYGIMHLFVGYFLDNFNIRKVYTLFVILWSTAQLSIGISYSFTSMYMARFALGTFEAAGQTGAARIIARIIPKNDRPLANGIMMSGGSIGAALAPAVMIALVNSLGWRIGFFILGGVGILWAILWFIWFKPPTEILTGKKTSSDEKTIVRQEDQWQYILKNPKFWACALGALFAIPIIHVLGAWLPTYFVQTWNLELKVDLAIYLVLIYIGFDLSLIISGTAISFMTRKNVPAGKARKIILIIAMIMMMGIILVSQSETVIMAVVLVLLLNIGRAAFGSVFLSFNQEISSAKVGSVAGIMGAIGAFSGSGLVYLFGILSGGSSGFTIPFILIGCLAVLGTLPLLFINWDNQ